ncbi:MULTISPECIES: NERD domain-containing protein [unclassified Thiocapsa]
MLPSSPNHTESGAEQKVFDRLKTAFADRPDWHLVALHSLNLPNHDYKRFGEIDFVIVGRPGLYALEVKGGGVACRNGVWTTSGRDDRRGTLRESPFRQAESALHALRKRLERQLGAGIVGRFPIGYGVVFPDCDWDDTGAEWDPAVLADARTARNLERWLTGLFRHWHQRHEAGGGRLQLPDTDAIKAVVDFLRPEVEVAVPLHVQVEEIAERVSALTEDQMRFLDAVEDNPRLLCTGGAGTGKTFLALELARRWAADGAQVLLACQSPWLRHWLAERFAAPNLSVALAGTAPLAARRAGIERFDALIVDEGQDLLQLALLDPLDRTLVGGLEQGRWCLFHDSNNQAGLFGPAEPEALALLDSFGPTHVRLATNCRNTRQILELVKISLGADMGVRGSGDGPAVRLHHVGSEAEAVALLAAELDRLTGRGGLAPQEITLLSPRPFAQSAAARLPTALGAGIVVLDEYALRDFPPPAISFAEIAAFKGLENEAVIVVDLPLPRQPTPLHYVSLSRARTCLTVIYDG